MLVEEQYLSMPSGRTLAYAHGGAPASTDVVIFLHGVFGVGEATTLSPALVERGVHFVAPTLPGWGKTSPPSSSQSFQQCLFDDLTALITRLHPQTENLRLYLAGGSFGTVAAQIVYGASYDDFPLGRQIAGLLLIAPISPPHAHSDFNKCLSSTNYLSLGTPYHVLPFNLTQRMGMLMLRHHLDTPEHAAKFIHEFAFSKLAGEEREVYEKWREARGFEEGQAEKDIGASMHHSVATTWKGFLDVPKIIHSNWGGYDPRSVHEDRQIPVLVVMNRGDRDHLLMGEWLVKNMKGTVARYEVGGHMASMFTADGIWEQFLKMTMPMKK
ncbi:hypothetical protein EIP91_000718 [Steccherinum ochraceum]|uniref:AB hydrolase-1 domain-containing protein n=1 Tax=Steccherinum ochraceum TaxID=92696 RepID=A0A4R0RF79_9APHY|nr:hypothetical protein EIP91_000718 [Steccherinum ochraceum]